MCESESEVAQSCPTLCNPMDCSLPGSSVHGIFQARVLEWVAISFSRGSSRPRDWTQVSRIVGRHFTIWATREDIEIGIYLMKFVSESENCCPSSTGWSKWSSLKLSVHRLCLLPLSLTGLLFSLCLWFSWGKGTWWSHSCLGERWGCIWLLLSGPQNPGSVDPDSIWFHLIPDSVAGYGETGQGSAKRKVGDWVSFCLHSLFTECTGRVSKPSPDAVRRGDGQGQVEKGYSYQIQMYQRGSKWIVSLYFWLTSWDRSYSKLCWRPEMIFNN